MKNVKMIQYSDDIYIKCPVCGNDENIASDETLHYLVSFEMKGIYKIKCLHCCQEFGIIFSQGIGKA